MIDLKFIRFSWFKYLCVRSRNLFQLFFLLYIVYQCKKECRYEEADLIAIVRFNFEDLQEQRTINHKTSHRWDIKGNNNIFLSAHNVHRPLVNSQRSSIDSKRGASTDSEQFRYKNNESNQGHTYILSTITQHHNFVLIIWKDA